MRKLIVLVLLLVGTTIIAQEGKRQHRRNEMEQYTPEQKSQLMLKKMTLALDLNDGQQKDVSAVIADQIAKKEAHKADMKAMKEKGVKPTKDERFAMHIKMLDEQIATKKRMEKILNSKQFEKWALLKKDLHDRHQEQFQGKSQRKRQG
jgi:periplasmic protein CpxP/Spy